MDFTTFRSNMLTLLKSRNMSVVNLGEAIEIPPTTLYRYLSGDREPALAYAAKIADYFHASLDWMCGLSSSPEASLPEGTDDFIKCYLLASPEDKQVVDLILSKYKR